MNRLLTTDEVAQHLSVDAKTVRALVEAEALRVVRIGKRCLRFDPRDIESFIEGAKACPSTPRADTGITTSSIGGGVTTARRGRRRAGPLKPWIEHDALNIAVYNFNPAP